MHSIAYNEMADELVVTNPFAQAVLTFRGDANGEVPPIRVIQGPKSGLGQPDVMSVDPVNNEYYVPIGVGGGNGGQQDSRLPAHDERRRRADSSAEYGRRPAVGRL